MLLNLSEKPSGKWEKKQYYEAIKQFGTVEDIEFPVVPANAKLKEVLLLSKEFIALIEPKIRPNERTDAIHIAGELTFCFALIYVLRLRGYQCITSTYQKETKVRKDGKKISRTKWISFRAFV